MALHDEPQEQVEVPQEAWPALPDLPLFTGPTVLNLCRRFHIHSPATLLKFGAADGEGIMTVFARSILGDCVPSVRIVTVPRSTSDHSTPSSASSSPTCLPYVLDEIYGPKTFECCASRSEWDDSRVRALHTAAKKTKDEADEILQRFTDESPPAAVLKVVQHATEGLERAVTLELLQRGATAPGDWDRPIFAHGDLSDRNILVDPDTLAITDFLDWEQANIMPAYWDYVNARLCGGHQPEWRKEILDVLRSVLRSECDAISVEGGEEIYRKTLAAWDAVVDVERIAQGYHDDCYWTFETGYSDVLETTNSPP